MINYYVSVLKNYVGFTGRAARPEFWWFVLTNFIITIVLDIIDVAIKSEILGIIYGLAVLLPGLAVSIRRLHDTDKSGWWVLIGIIPIVGAIVLIVFCAQAGTPGPNKYGQGPNAVTGGSYDANTPYVG